MVTTKDLEQFRYKAKMLHKNLIGYAEVGWGDSPKWSLLRGIIMDTFGTNGLDGEIQDLIERCGKAGRQDEIKTRP